MTGTCFTNCGRCVFDLVLDLLNHICSLCFDDLSPPSMVFFFSPNINVFIFWGLITTFVDNGPLTPTVTTGINHVRLHERPLTRLRTRCEGQSHFKWRKQNKRTNTAFGLYLIVKYYLYRRLFSNWKGKTLLAPVYIEKPGDGRVTIDEYVTQKISSFQQTLVHTGVQLLSWTFQGALPTSNCCGTPGLQL